MPVTEILFRIEFHTRSKKYRMYLLVWGGNAMEAVRKLDGIFGPQDEYAIDTVSPQTRNGKQITRPAVEPCFIGRLETT